MLGGLQMKGKDDIKPIKTSSGDSIYLFWELQMELNTESIILMNSTGKYYYERGSAKQTEGERLSNFIIEPLFVIEDSDKKIKYILKLISNDYSKVIEIEGENLAINNSFKKFCMSYGMFNWRGKQYHLDDLAEFIMTNTIKKLTTITYSGFNSSEKVW